MTQKVGRNENFFLFLKLKICLSAFLWNNFIPKLMSLHLSDKIFCQSQKQWHRQDCICFSKVLNWNIFGLICFFCLMMDQSSTDLRYFYIAGFDRGRTSNLLKSSSFLSSFLFVFSFLFSFLFSFFFFVFSFVFSFFKDQRNPFCWKAFFVLIKGQLQKYNYATLKFKH